MKIKLTESQLKQIVNESVRNVLSELDWRTYQNAAFKAKRLSDTAEDEYERQRRENQRSKFQAKADEMTSKQYDLEDFDKNNRRENYRNYKYPTPSETNRASRRLDDMNKFYGGKQEYKNGSWQNKQ